jgi:hypothetical protein
VVNQKLLTVSQPSIWAVVLQGTQQVTLAWAFFMKTWHAGYATSWHIQFPWRYFLQYISFFSGPGNLGTSHLPQSATLPAGIDLGISVCLFGWWLDTLKTSSKCCSYFLRIAFSSTMFATKRLFSFYFSIRISLFWASELITHTNDTMTGSNKS